MPRKFLETLHVCLVRGLVDGRFDGRSSRSGSSKRHQVKNLRWLKRELVVVFLNQGPAKKLNYQTRGKDYATDVLSFSGAESVGDDAAESKLNLGELVFCPQVIRRQAKEHRHSYRAELSYMFIHGVLHLLGYDHEQGGRAERQMFSLQDQLFEDFIQNNAKSFNIAK